MPAKARSGHVAIRRSAVANAPSCCMAFTDDLVTALDFDHSGRFLAAGDKAGRVCIFENQTVSFQHSVRVYSVVKLIDAPIFVSGWEQRFVCELQVLHGVYQS